MSETDWKSVRASFPVCSRMTYLNAAGGSPMSVDAAIEGKKYYDEMLLYGDTCWDEWLERTEQVRQKLGCFIGAAPEEIAFVPNTSTGMGYIAQLLRGLGRVVTPADEFPSSTYPWLHLGFTVDFMTSVEGIYRLSDLERTVREDHRILVVSMVQYRTGVRQQLRELGGFCRSNGLLFVVNGTQAMGIFPVDVVKDSIDFFVFSGLKWACSGYGTSGLFIRKEHIIPDRMPMVGWRSVRSPEKMNNQELDLRHAASVLEAGSPSFPGIFALGGALDMFNRIGREACMNRVLYLNRMLEKSLLHCNLPVIPVKSEDHRSGIIIIPTAHGRQLVGELAARNIVVSARGKGLRVSVNIFNNEEDIEKLVMALQEIRSLI